MAGQRCLGGLPTKIENISTSARVQAQCGIARGAVLRLKLANVLIEARLVGDMAA